MIKCKNCKHFKETVLSGHTYYKCLEIWNVEICDKDYEHLCNQYEALVNEDSMSKEKALNLDGVICCGVLEKMNINWMKLGDGRRCMPYINGYEGAMYRVNNCPSCGKYVRNTIV